jgi:hypothetical protein
LAYALAAFAAYHDTFQEAKMLFGEVALKAEGNLHKSYLLALAPSQGADQYWKQAPLAGNTSTAIARPDGESGKERR